ncbi:hypothetical protein JKF63_07009 [Porcisia hertigi]|uniref:Uncharacterized protein n=1 Tax=Porcisia hertigi TaxID=2761500 RepID=A0A836LJ13_9TRYP|nr:hypothetical protein JKF63_07009 [Porcisia hertigi]
MPTLPEVAMVGTSLVLGMTMVMGVNAINSAPSFMLDYYKYLAGSEAAEPRSPVFWKNILNFYTVVTIVAQAIHEPTNLTSFMCRFSLLFRLQVSCVLMLIELFVILIMPHTHTPEYGAIAAMMIMAYIGGAARAYFENTGYALFAPCPPTALTGMLIGSPLSGALVSLLQIILRASMPESYDAVLLQSLIYFCLAMGIIFLAGVLLAALLYNSYARKHVAELRSSRSPWANIYRPRQAVKEVSNGGTCSKRGAAGSQGGVASGCLTDSDSEQGNAGMLLEMVPGNVAASGNRVRYHPNTLFDDHVLIHPREDHEMEPVTQAGAANSSYPLITSAQVEAHVVSLPKGALEKKLNGACAGDDGNLTTAELLQEVKLWPVVKKIYPMMIACFLAFCVTYLVYPGIILAADSADGTFTTFVMAAFNFADLLGRLLTLSRRLWTPRKVILIASIVRIVLVPLLFLCATHTIPSKAAVYVFTVITGLSNGFVGTLSMVYSPDTPSLSTEGERAMAGQLTGVCLLVGCAVGSLIQLAEVIPFT